MLTKSLINNRMEKLHFGPLTINLMFWKNIKERQNILGIGTEA
jgi:hypothetical protein